MNTWHKNKLTIGIAVLALILIGFFLFSGGDERKSVLGKADIEALDGKSITVNGEMKCLPYRKEDPEQMCVKGLEGDNGVIYALDGVGIKSPEIRMSLGTEVIAEGVFAAAAKNSEADVFSYDGVLVLTSLKKAE